MAPALYARKTYLLVLVASVLLCECLLGPGAVFDLTQL